ncbi:ATP-binding protein [Ramlibacter albus]|uniref:histidine kinase n=1 Tax=Ramlibacter albus TaxID=2079448 RepID=A0A923S7C9_9BURK|nr:ATP-binding protein [Ramlibacter albus]MBC5767017.1 hypothetical protein [Ramlibacter albus]
MSATLDDLLAFIDIGGGQLQFRQVCVEGLARSVLQRLLAAENGPVELRIDPLPPCWADAGLLELVLRELLANALKFSAGTAPRRIAVGCEPAAPGRCVYTVQDNGVGLGGHHAGQLFKLFGRLHPSGTYEGRGAGLAKASRAAQKLGGRLGARPAAGGGATFVLDLRAAP